MKLLSRLGIRPNPMIQSPSKAVSMSWGPILAMLLFLMPQIWPQARTLPSESEALFQKVRSLAVTVRVQKSVSEGEAGAGLRQVFMNGVLVDVPLRTSIIKMAQSNGIAYDSLGHVVSYIGYKWLALNPKAPGVTVELIRSDGLTTDAKLVGIDQRSGIAVIQASPELKLVPGTVLPSAEVDKHLECYLIDIESREPVKKVTLRRKAIGSEISYSIPDQENRRQGQVLFTLNWQLLGFVAGTDEPSNQMDPLGVQLAQDLLGSTSRIISTGKDVEAGWIGVFINERGVGADRRQVVVADVVKGGPAARSGVRPGDILQRINGIPILRDRQFIRQVQWTDVGSLAKIQLQRAKEIMELSVPVAVRGDMPEVTLPTFYLQLSQDPEGLNAPQIELRQVQPQGKSDTVNVVASSNPPRLGIVGDDLTLQLGKYFGVDGGRGVLVITVTEGSLAERYGMKAGDVIVAMNGEAVSNQLEFFRILTRHGSNPIWDFRLVRERKLIDLRVFPQRPKE